MWAALGIASAWFLVIVCIVVMAAAIALLVMGVIAGFRSGLAALHGQKPPRDAVRVRHIYASKRDDR